MIDERMEEQASLRVLGALSETEAREFKKAMQTDRELREFVARLIIATDALAGEAPLVKPPPQLRTKILAQLDAPQKIVAQPAAKFGAAFWAPWALAAGLAVLCLVLFSQDSQLRITAGGQAQQISALNQLAQSLQSATNDLQRTVTALEETNRLVNLRVAMLNSLVAGAHKTVAVTLWDSQHQNGVFVAENLKPLPTSQDYELWVIDENQKPVAAGVFHVEPNGSIRMEFKPSRLIKTAGKFAVTEEVKGGVSSPTVKNMVLASN